MPDSFKLIGPFKQLLTLRNIPLKGAVKDTALEIIEDGGIVVSEGEIKAFGNFETLTSSFSEAKIERVDQDGVALPGFIDAHTHICFGGKRSMDFAARNSGISYLDIAKAGGGIWSSVKHTREASQEALTKVTVDRLNQLAKLGITTVEVKSGYGLNVEQELKMLSAINEANNSHVLDVIPTCLAAHIVPKDFEGSEQDYLDLILDQLAPVIKEKKLAKRFDIFIEESAFSIERSTNYLNKLKALGFDLTVHGDQFSAGGSSVAIEVGALSVDHLEASGPEEIKAIAASDVIAVALPGASIGIGCPFTPARKLLDAGAALAIASDWNPGSAPQGNLLLQASILSCFEKLSTAEVFAGICFRAARALGLKDRGVIDTGMKSDFVSFPTDDYRDILYYQGGLVPNKVWKNGIQIL